MARPPTYTSDDDKPVSVSLRIPRDLYDQAQHHAHIRRTSLTALLVEGLRLRLETPVDPRDILVSHDNTVMQELQELIDARIHVALTAQAFSHLASAPSAPTFLHDENTVMQEPQTQAKPAHANDERISFDEDSTPASVPIQAPSVEDTQYSNVVIQEQSPAYDTTKYYLGKLCPRAHAYQGTAQSLRYRGSKRCIACDTEDAQTRRKAKASS